jgi:hypothetical protein
MVLEDFHHPCDGFVRGWGVTKSVLVLLILTPRGAERQIDDGGLPIHKGIKKLSGLVVHEK